MKGQLPLREERDLVEVRAASLEPGDVVWPAARRVERVLGKSTLGVVVALSYSDSRAKPHVAILQPGTPVSILRREEESCRRSA